MSSKVIGKKFLFLVGLYGVTPNLLTMADTFPKTGKVYQLGSDHKAVLYLFTQTFKADTYGGETLSTTFTEPDGIVAVTEEVYFRDHKLKRYKIDQKQEGFLNQLEIDGQDSTFRRTNEKTSAAETNDDDWGDNYLTIPQLMYFVVSHWDSLMQGETVKFRLALLEKMQTYGFKMFRDEEKWVEGTEVVILKVKPSGFFISLFSLVGPFYLTIDRQTKKLIQISGNSLPKLKKGPNELRDLEADIVYDE